MEVGVILLTLVAYGLAIYLWVREHTPNYTVAMLGSHLAVLLSPFWQALYRFSYNPTLPALYRLGIDERLQSLTRLQEYSLPRAVFAAAWLSLLPALVVFYLYRHRWWFPGYVTSILTFTLFVVYHLMVDIVVQRQGWLLFNGDSLLPLGVPQLLLSALMNGLVSLGVLAALLLTRRYSITSLLWIVLPIPLALSLLVHGLLGAPLYTALLLQAQSWAGAIGLLGTLGLVFSGAHIIAGSLERPADWRQTI
ncbi:MAG TPA: hypothetical protein PLO33_10190 [Kouleothrix sp.]|uniref:hypothetical protein n=1 Tax=Kouleothrix sp. TaxID=2779161 RepID=UPI002BD12BD7|nr:hypothetical protein [Kouleothrix sp.]HRC76038.1 hypothetical protein [Kouleothrix sp.]